MSLCDMLLYLLYPKAQSSESHLLFVVYALV